MPGYLDAYGAGDERRARTIKRIVLALVAVIVLVLLGKLLVFLFLQTPEERRVQLFMQQLAAGQYQQAYATWGCTETQPCPYYQFPDFMKDWGPQTTPVGKFDVLNGEPCGSGTIVDVDTGKSADKRIWVEHSSLTLNLPPYEECPHRNRVYDFFRNLKYHLHGRTYK